MKKLTILPKRSGRNSQGRITVRHQGGRSKRFLREIDWRRDKLEIPAKVEAIEYDPNRNARIAKVIYNDGDRRYILAPFGLKVDQIIITSDDASIKVGNTLRLAKIPVGETIHCIEVTPGKGAQVVRSAGSAAVIHGKEDNWVLVKMPSGEIRRFSKDSKATLGQVSNPESRTEVLRKAGKKRWRGIRPSVRGVAMHPNAHPHGGGEGRSGIGMSTPKTVYGRPAVGRTRKKGKYSDKLIITRRK